MGYITDILEHHHLLLSMVRRDFRNRYAGSTLGVLWSILQPLFMMGIMWAVFTFGLKAQSLVDGVPFLPWLFSGLIVWNFFSEGLILASNSFLDYSFLVKKVQFRLHLVPLVRILSAGILHFIFLGIVALVMIAYGYYPQWSWLMLPYYMIGQLLLMSGLSTICSVLIVFVRDLGQLIQILLQVGFWGTPIVWSLGQIPVQYRSLFQWNPVYYIVSGYRRSFLGIENGSPSLHETFLFWGIVIFFLVCANYIFSRLRPQIADVI